MDKDEKRGLLLLTHNIQTLGGLFKVPTSLDNLVEFKDSRSCKPTRIHTTHTIDHDYSR